MAEDFVREVLFWGAGDELLRLVEGCAGDELLRTELLEVVCFGVAEVELLRLVVVLGVETLLDELLLFVAVALGVAELLLRLV